ncbi:hypothetical protein EYF80_031031 [Liparis tanakae]|uniref:Uncharacterized protein n=1 Tax=Liparis tanakae TaxID=230148 RepID=A0A4Z2GZ34_9TELE|nr:hypothetical protein EYF80_031031 [Liparis tanakae]
MTTMLQTDTVCSRSTSNKEVFLPTQLASSKMAAALTFHFPLVLPPARRFWHRGPDIDQEADVGVATPEVALLLEGHGHGNVGHYAMLANIHSLTPFLPLSRLPVKAPLLLNLGYTGTVPSGLNKHTYYFRVTSLNRYTSWRNARDLPSLANVWEQSTGKELYLNRAAQRMRRSLESYRCRDQTGTTGGLPLLVPKPFTTICCLLTITKIIISLLLLSN